MDKSGRPMDAASVQTKDELLKLTSDIVTAYLTKNQIDLHQLPQVLESVYAKLSGLGTLPSGQYQSSSLQNTGGMVNSVARDNSITPDYIVCLEDGVRLKTLKRYLFRKYRLTPEQYRIKWGLPPDYPMVAPNYAAKRSALAKEIGLGSKRRKGAPFLRKARGKSRAKAAR